MAIVRRDASINVLDAARQRIINTFRNGLPVYMSFSGGKDSLVLADITLKLIQEGKIDPGQLTVHFVDEEAIFPCIEKTTMEWRKKFLLAGARFEWFCIEVKHFNCFNELSNDESFICWDSEKEAVWVRRPPPFAIRSHPLLRPRVDSYQDWLGRVCMDGLALIGIRTAESLQRLLSIATSNDAGKLNVKEKIYPIYDWQNNDVWLYLLEQDIDIPEIYLYLWQSGAGRTQLRVSQFFSIDTARSLVKMNEYYPDLMERIIRREPNAYLAALYWDSEMFGRSSRSRREKESTGVQKDYKAELLKLFGKMDLHFDTPHKRQVADRYRNFFLGVHSIATDKDYKIIYEGLISGDPKLRTLRSLYNQVYGRYIDGAKMERSNKL